MGFLKVIIRSKTSTMCGLCLHQRASNVIYVLLCSQKIGWNAWNATTVRLWFVQQNSQPDFQKEHSQYHIKPKLAIWRATIKKTILGRALSPSALELGPSRLEILRTPLVHVFALICGFLLNSGRNSSPKVDRVARWSPAAGRRWLWRLIL